LIVIKTRAAERLAIPHFLNTFLNIDSLKGVYALKYSYRILITFHMKPESTSGLQTTRLKESGNAVICNS